jgi:hypothetical protein
MADEILTERLYGNYRAKVVDNKDKEMFGRIFIWIPDLMPTTGDETGLWARPANNPIGGRNKQEGTDENYFMGSSYIPRKGAWVWVFFEAGNVNRPYYFGGLDLENTQVLPENQVGTNYEDKWTIFKSHEGRVIVVSDDPDDARIEIGGKKRKMLERNEIPTGDVKSVYEIDDNMTTILFDERDGLEKVLVRTRLGDFFHIDINERKLQAEFESDIEIKTNGNFFLTAKKDIHIVSEEENINLFTQTKSINLRAEREDIKMAALEDIDMISVAGNVYIEAEASELHVISGTDMYHTSGGSHNVAVQLDDIVQAGNQMSRQAGTTHDTDAGTTVNVQSGTSRSATAATPGEIADGATEATPEGERNT